jgi:hypothetical protein
MDEKLQAVLAQLKLAPGAKVHSARWQADGSARVLVDEGIGGVKVHVLKYNPQIAQIYADKAEAVEEISEAPFDVSKKPEAESPPEKRVVSKRSRSRK